MLWRAVDSVFSQNLLPQEIIIVASDPEEKITIENIASSKYNFGALRVISSSVTLQGGAARNLGWRSSRGEVVFFLDDDDYWAENNVAEHLAAHFSGDVDVVHSGVWYVFGDAQKKIERRGRILGPDVIASLLRNSLCPPTTSCVSVKRSALEAVDGFDDMLPSYQDLDLWYRLALAGCAFGCVAAPIAYFVQHGEQRVSMDPKGRGAGAEALLRKFPGAEEVSQFLIEEALGTFERAVVYSARRGEASSWKNYLENLNSKSSKHLSRTIWIGAKVLYFLAISKFQIMFQAKQ